MVILCSHVTAKVAFSISLTEAKLCATAEVEVMPGTQKEPRRIDSFTRQVSRVIKSGRDEVAIRLLPQLGSQDRPVTVCYCNYLFNSCARSRNVTVSVTLPPS